MEQRPFPGSPRGFNLVFSQHLSEATDELQKNGTERSLQLADILGALSMCLLSSRSYFDLFIRIGGYYPELQSFWNEEVYKKNGGVIGTGVGKLKDSNEITVDKSIVDQLPPESVNLIGGILSFTQNKDEIDNIPDVDDQLREQMLIFNQMIWAIYMGLFNPKFFEKNLETFVTSAKEAEVEIAAMLKEINPDLN